MVTLESKRTPAKNLRGRLLIREGDNRQVTHREPDGTYTPLAQRLGGKRINRPNDLVTRSDGSIYFTDPGGPSLSAVGF